MQSLPNSNNAAPVTTTSNARRILTIIIGIGAAIFLIIMTSPAPASVQPSLEDSGANKISVETPSNNNNNNLDQKPPKTKSSSSNDQNVFWTQGTGGRISPESSASISTSSDSGCSIRPGLRAWTIHCPCSSSSFDKLDFILEFASPFTSIEDSKCSHYLRSKFATADIPPSDGLTECESKSLSVKSVNSKQIQIVISDIQKKKDDVCSSNNKLYFVTEVDVKLGMKKETEWKTCFASFGDWGRYQKASIDTATLLEKTLQGRPEVKFWASTGDNFYPVGVKSVNDPQFDQVFERLYSGKYTRPLLSVVVEGNHDAFNKPIHQIVYGKLRSDRWYYPNVHYGFTFPLPPSSSRKKNVADFAMFYSLYSYGRLPIERQFPVMQDFFSETGKILKNKKDDKKIWRIAMGHQPVYSGARHGQDGRVQGQMVKYEAALKKSRVSVYLNGDDHLLESHRRTFPGNSETGEKPFLIDYFVTGAGGGSGLDKSKLLNSTYLSYPDSIGFTLHCFSNQESDVMTTEFFMVKYESVQGSATELEESKRKVPLMRTPLL